MIRLPVALALLSVRVLVPVVVLLTVSSAAARTPHAMLFRFNDAAIYGPIEAKATLYPSKAVPATGTTLGRSVDVQFDASAKGDWLLRLPLDESMLPSSARPAIVRVMRETFFGWKPVAAHVLLRKGKTHALYVTPPATGVYVVVMGGPSAPAPVETVIARSLNTYRDWLAHGPSDDVTSTVPAADLKAIGAIYGEDLSAVRVVKFKAGAKARAVYDGMMRFFHFEPQPVPQVMTVGDKVVLLGDVLSSDADKTRVRFVLAQHLWRVIQERRSGGRYVGDWTDLLVKHGLDKHPLEQEVALKSATVLRKLQ